MDRGGGPGSMDVHLALDKLRESKNAAEQDLPICFGDFVIPTGN